MATNWCRELARQESRALGRGAKGRTTDLRLGSRNGCLITSHSRPITPSHTVSTNVLNSTLTSEIQNGEGVNFLAIAGLSDSFVGKVPVVTDGNGQTNADGRVH